MSGAEPTAAAATPRWAWLPAIGSWRYHLMLVLLGSLVLGPLGGVTASYMNFSIGFFVGGQVVAGILGSIVTMGYGPAGRHGANLMQTAAASVASMAAMGILLQAMIWLGLPQPPAWQLMLFMGAIGMYGAGVGMVYTPILVDRMRLTFPSGLAVANILRALTDPLLLRLSVARLAGGMGLGIVGGLGSAKLEALGRIELSSSTLGAGMLVGPRVGIPALVAGLTGWALVPGFVAIGWLQDGEPFRKITFLIGLGLAIGAAAYDIAVLLAQAAQRWRQTSGTRPAATAGPDAGAAQPAAAPPPAHLGSGLGTGRLVMWILGWGAAVVWLGHGLLGQPVGFLVLALALVLVFALVNGISLGISDSTPISAAFVTAVVLMAALGLKDPAIGLMAGAVLLVSCAVSGDMQQDRSTGWRLGTDRRLQFRYQVLGLLAGAVLSVGFARLFIGAYPVLVLDQTTLAAADQPAQWQSAMTYKLVGALRSLTDDKPFQRHAIVLGIGLGLAVQWLRQWLFARPAYQRWKSGATGGRVCDFVLDAVLLPNPYAYSFGTFFGVATGAWLAIGSVIGGVADWWARRPASAGAKATADTPSLPPDMSTVSLIGGGLIAGDALAALGLGVVGLLAAMVG